MQTITSENEILDTSRPIDYKGLYEYFIAIIFLVNSFARLGPTECFFFFFNFLLWVFLSVNTSCVWVCEFEIFIALYVFS